MRMFLILSAALLQVSLSACNSGDGPATPTGTVGSVSTTTTTSTPPTTTTAPPATTTVPVQRVLRTATFQDANGYQTAGSARIVRTGNEYSLELLDDFRTSQSALLDLRLCNDPNCRSGAVANYGELKAFVGAQVYPLADDGSQYSHVVIFCRGVQLAFGYGALR